MLVLLRRDAVYWQYAGMIRSSKKGYIMKYSNNRVLKVDFDRRKTEANAAQYIALKQFERAEKISRTINIAAVISWGAFIAVLIIGVAK
mgnify:CR=1 FL=1|jgi:hypothetical protein